MSYLLIGFMLCIGGLLLAQHFGKKSVQKETQHTRGSGPGLKAVTVDWVNQQLKERTDKLDQLKTQLDSINQTLDSLKSVSFKDVSPSYYAYKHIRFLSAKGIIKGYPELHQFFPNHTVTRYQAAAMLIKAKGIPIKDSPSQFTDISNSAKDQAFREVAMTALNNGIFKGIPQPDGTLKFEPRATVTRQQMAAIINNSFQFTGQTTYSFTPFSDVPKSSGQYESIKTLVTYHIVKGKADGSFNPKGKTTRGQFCIFLASAMDPHFRY